MAKISEAEFERLVAGIQRDREAIIRHNPIGTPPETLLWMLMSCLISYLSLSDNEAPCFTGRPNAETYREAIGFILRGRKSREFDERAYIDRLSEE